MDFKLQLPGNSTPHIKEGMKQNNLLPPFPYLSWMKVVVGWKEWR